MGNSMHEWLLGNQRKLAVKAKQYMQAPAGGSKLNKMFDFISWKQTECHLSRCVRLKVKKKKRRITGEDPSIHYTLRFRIEIHRSKLSAQWY